ncbi:MAG: glycosidase [Patescibacteria group bacterium]
MFQLKRYPGNPILSPIKEHHWESKMVFNCATVFRDNKVHLIYRARGEDQIDDIPISRLGYAIFKEDGVTLEKRYDYPVFKPKEWYEPAGCEDPRITEIDGKCYMLYTAYLGRRTAPYFEEESTNVAMASTNDFINWERHGLLLPSVLEPEKNGILFPKKIKGYYVLYYRIHPAIYVAYSKSLENPDWIGHKAIMQPRKNSWDSYKIGAGPPPIETNEGWLFIYHGVDKEGTRRDAITGKIRPKFCYRLGVILIDKNNPEKILYRSEKPILEPKEKYEKKGLVPNVVFSCGANIIKDMLYVYYGGADTVIGVAMCNISELIKLIKNKKI